jgi:hypothetical protein
LRHSRHDDRLRCGYLSRHDTILPDSETTSPIRKI